MKKKYNLTKAQLGVLYTFDENGNVVLTNKNFIWGHLKINQKVDFNRLKKAINYCFKKNDSTRIKLCLEDDKLLQYFEDYEEQSLEIVDVNTENDVKDLENEIINRPFEMFNSYLFQIAIYRYENGFGGVILKLNHVIADGYTMGLLLYEVLGYYSKTQNKIISFSYLDYINSEENYPNSKRYEQDKEYWNKMFEEGVPDSAFIPSDKENYSLSKATYEKNIGKHIINTQYLKYKDLSKENEIISNLKNKKSHILSVVSIATAKQQAETLFKSLNIIVYVLVLFSGALSFVVFYSLAYINISERQREIATLKVLGFYNKEIDNYILK